MSTAQLRVEGLAGIELDELREELSDGDFLESVQEQHAEQHYGEPATITALLLLGAATVNAVSAWLARRHKDDPGTEYTITTSPDGSVTVRLGPSAPARSGPVISAAAIRAQIEEAVKAASG
jgi:hypothetical protein